ncbi:MAG: DegV family protein [Firmicutes bacterium HGW-Firmicutes-9]|jgi:DegV family protein with EDD domain|nr:MAG: DegV family protein [Firmicutes bacterium HGW-Firmicutes-9]
MQPYILSCCSTADLSKDYFEQREIHYVCFHFTIDGEEYADDLGQSMPFEEFYGKIAAGAMPTTSLVNTAQFIEFFEPFLKEGKDILHLSFSSGLSGTYAAALLAQEELKERYPDRTLVIVDSLGASSGYGLMVDTLADMRDNGVSLQDAAAWIEEHKLNLHHWFFSTDLTHYKRGGRISPTAFVVGSILGINPLMNMDDGGHLTPRFKINGKKRVMREIVKQMELHAENGLDYDKKCFISNSACHEDAETVAALVESTFPKLNGKVLINSVGTVVGSHTGPGTVALFFWGDSRKKD